MLPFHFDSWKNGSLVVFEKPNLCAIQVQKEAVEQLDWISVPYWLCCSSLHSKPHTGSALDKALAKLENFFGVFYQIQDTLPPELSTIRAKQKKMATKWILATATFGLQQLYLGVTTPPTYRWKIHHCKCQGTSNWWCWYWCLGCSSPSHSLKASRNHDDVSWNKGFVFFKQASACFQGLSNLSICVFTWYHLVSDVFQKPCHL